MGRTKAECHLGDMPSLPKAPFHLSSSCPGSAVPKPSSFASPFTTFPASASATFSPSALASHSAGDSCPAAQPHGDPSIQHVSTKSLLRAGPFSEPWETLAMGEQAQRVPKSGFPVYGASRPTRRDVPREPRPHGTLPWPATGCPGGAGVNEHSVTTVNRLPDAWLAQPRLFCHDQVFSEASCGGGGCVPGAGDTTS